jgi:HupE/UreJ protein
MCKTHRALLARALAAALLFFGVQAILRAHDVPEEVDIQAYIKPQGTNLQVVLRVPLLAVSDTNLPKDGTGYLAMPYLGSALGEAANQISTGIVFLENDERLSQFDMANARISLPSDKSFDTYEEAVTHVRGPKLPDSTQLYYNQGYLDLEMLYPIRSASDAFGVQVLLARGLANRTVTYVHYVLPDGSTHAFRLVDQTDVVHLDPSWGQAVRVFVADGFFHFLDGLDQLLFVIVLVLPYRRVRDVVAPVASFAVAHTLTLTLAGFGLMPSGNWFPMFIGALIALSVVYVAIEDALGVNLRKRWMVAFGFGLVHGFGFAFALRDSLQFAGGHSLAALLSFSAGLEMGLIIILAIALPAFSLLFTQVVSERAGTIVISVLAGHAAWHWMTERFNALQLMSLPVLDLAVAATVVRWLLWLTVAGGGLWFLAGLLRRRPHPSEFSEEKSIVDSRQSTVDSH